MKFLYYDMTELWGHVWKVEAGNGKTGASKVGDWLANPLVNLKM